MEKIWKAPEGYVEKKYNYVYELRLKEDPRYFYVGKRSTNLEKDPYMGSGRGLSEFRQKYGKDCFSKTILSYWPTAADALEEERRTVTESLVKDPFCINRIRGGGTFDTSGRHLTEEHRRLLSIKAKERPKSLEFLCNMGRIQPGTKMSKDACQKNREARKKEIWVHRGNDEYEKRKIEEWPKLQEEGWVRGRKPFSKETRKRMSLAKQGKKQSPEVVKRRSESIKKSWILRKLQKD